MGRIACGAVDAMGCRPEIGFLGFKDVRHKDLRIAVNDGEPGALHLDHHAMPFQKAVVLCVQAEGVLKDRVWRDRRRPFEAGTVASSKHFARHHELIARQIPIFRIMLGVDVNQLDDPISITTCSRRKKVGDDFPGDAYVSVQCSRLPTQHVGAVIHKALVLYQPVGPLRTTGEIGHLDRAIPVRHRVGRIRNVPVKRKLAALFGALPREVFIRPEIQPTLLAVFLWRPGFPAPPAVCTRLKSQRLREIEFTFILEKVSEPRRLDLLWQFKGVVGALAHPPCRHGPTTR